MNIIKKLSGSFLLGLAVIGLALSTSAFTEKRAIDGTTIVNRSTGHQLLDVPYDPDDCLNSSETCSYNVLEPDQMPVGQTDFTTAEIQEYLDNGWIEENPEKGVYQ